MQRFLKTVGLPYLGLRSFAKTYPASVASGALRGLIGCLRKDAEDVETVKVVLETLLMLFNPDDNSVRELPLALFVSGGLILTCK